MKDRNKKMDSGATRKFWICKWAVFSSFMIITVIIRIFLCSYGEFKKGEESLQAREYLRAIMHYERAIRFYFPFNPYNSSAISGLKEIFEDATRRGEEWLAREALSSIRGPILATQHFTISRRLMREGNEAMMRGGSPITLKDAFPSDPIWSFFAILGFLGWSGGVVTFIAKRTMGKGRGKGLSGFIATAVFLGLSLWIMGMINA